MRIQTLSLLLLATPLLTYAQTPAPFAERLARTQAACLTEARATQTPVFKTVADLGYTRNAIDKTLGVIGKPVHDGVDQIRYARVAKAERQDHKQKLQEVDRALQTFFAEHPAMSPAQKACVATCTSSHLIDFLGWSAQDFEIAAPTVASGRGLCRHFATIADHFMKKIGVPCQVISGESKGEDHAFISVRIDGKQYWMEPQHDQCLFYSK